MPRQPRLDVIQGGKSEPDDMQLAAAKLSLHKKLGRVPNEEEVLQHALREAVAEFQRSSPGKPTDDPPPGAA